MGTPTLAQRVWHECNVQREKGCYATQRKKLSRATPRRTHPPQPSANLDTHPPGNPASP